MPASLRRYAITLEVIILLIVTLIFFAGDQNRVWALLLLVPFAAWHLLTLPTLASWRNPLMPILLALLGLGIISIYTAPFTFGNARITLAAFGWSIAFDWAWINLARLALGVLMVVILVEYARTPQQLYHLLWITVIAGLLLAILALCSTQWNEKSAPLQFIIRLLPNLRNRPELPFIGGGFNGNEIGGALIWMTPLIGGLALLHGQSRTFRILAAVVFGLLLLALFLGQSRMALLGFVTAMLLVCFTMIQTWRGRSIALAALALFSLLQIALVVYQTRTLGDRDEESGVRRVEMWIQGYHVIQDHPLTGVGMNQFRSRAVRAFYPVTGYENRVLPHAHNEIVQIATDLGVPGVIVYLSAAASLALVIWKTARRDHGLMRGVALASGAGLLGHAIFGMADAIALWDRYIFLLWWLIGLISIAAVLSQQPESESALQDG